MPLYRKPTALNYGLFARIDRNYAALGSVSVPVADGLTANVGTNFNFLPILGATTEYFQSNNPSSYPSVNGIYIPGLNSKFVKITYGIQLSSNNACNITPLLGDGYGGIIQGVNGAPKLIATNGYGFGVDTGINQTIWIEAEFVFKGFIENLGNIGIYRNSSTSDGTSRTFSIRKYFIEIRQLEI